MKIYTRSYNDELFGMMKEFIPADVEVQQIKGYDRWEDALRFIKDVINRAPGIAIILDEDCFIYDFQKLYGLITHFITNGYTHAGMPDRGTVPHRTLNWTTLNPFFNILDCDALRNHGAMMPIDKPSWINAAAPEFEIFDDYYTHLYKIGKPLFLGAATMSDGITTHLKDHNGKYFALHSWYSREFTHAHRARIMEVYKTAKEWKKG